ncbi:hypothetical protein MVEN_02151900 [Mycena venus]|uniref:DUF5648 domain-containing protein n=1 Tax=Mycena venus TaxID=2733690 RepID=A0A8H6XAE7_9AGAR|nr:hypothetical protein MVEN_02151900 [Mycena venus]
MLLQSQVSFLKEIEVVVLELESTTVINNVTDDLKNHPYVFDEIAARTTSATERDLALESGYADGGTMCFIYWSHICGSIPFYRIYNSLATTEHF